MPVRHYLERPPRPLPQPLPLTNRSPHLSGRQVWNTNGRLDVLRAAQGPRGADGLNELTLAS